MSHTTKLRLTILHHAATCWTRLLPPWATPHPRPCLTLGSRILLSHYALCWALPHRIEPRRTIYWTTQQPTGSSRALISHATTCRVTPNPQSSVALWWATPHPAEPRRTLRWAMPHPADRAPPHLDKPCCNLLSHAAKYWTTPHPSPPYVRKVQSTELEVLNNPWGLGIEQK